MSFIDAVRGRMSKLRSFLSENNFMACANTSSDLLRTSEFGQYPEGVFIGEFLEAFFVEFRGLASGYEVKNEDVERISKAINPVLDFIEAKIPITDMDNKAKLYDLLSSARYVLTETQITYYREKSPKPRRFPPQMMPMDESEE